MISSPLVLRVLEAAPRPWGVGRNHMLTGIFKAPKFHHLMAHVRREIKGVDLEVVHRFVYATLGNFTSFTFGDNKFQEEKLEGVLFHSTCTLQSPDVSSTKIFCANGLELADSGHG